MNDTVVELAAAALSQSRARSAAPRVTREQRRDAVAVTEMLERVGWLLPADPALTVCIGITRQEARVLLDIVRAEATARFERDQHLAQRHGRLDYVLPEAVRSQVTYSLREKVEDAVNV